MQRLEGGELFGDHERGVIGQHHAAEPTRNVLVAFAMCAINTAGAELRDRGHPVVFGDPQPPVTESLHVDRVASTPRGLGAGVDPVAPPSPTPGPREGSSDDRHSYSMERSRRSR